MMTRSSRAVDAAAPCCRSPACQVRGRSCARVELLSPRPGVASRRSPAQLARAGAVSHLRAIEGGRLLLAGSSNGDVALFDPEDGSLLSLCPQAHQHPVTQLAESDAARLVWRLAGPNPTQLPPQPSTLASVPSTQVSVSSQDSVHGLNAGPAVATLSWHIH